MQENYKQESYKKGAQFENYVEEILFPEAHYELIYKTSDSKQNINRYPTKSREPDFQFKCRISGKEFYVEAKWRAKPYNDEYEVLSPNQYKSFPSLHTEAKPIFIAFGYGGQPSNPDCVSLIPLKKIKTATISPTKVYSYDIPKAHYPNSNFLKKDHQSEEKSVNKEANTYGRENNQPRPNYKTLGLAAIGLLAILIGIYSFAFSNSPNELQPKEKLHEIIADYYQSMNSNQIEKLPEFLSSHVDSWYGTKNMSTNQIIKDAQSHRETFPFSSSDIDWNSFKVMEQENGDYIASYDMIYKRRKDIHEEYKVFNLHLISTWNRDFKMKSIREIRD